MFFRKTKKNCYKHFTMVSTTVLRVTARKDRGTYTVLDYWQYSRAVYWQWPLKRDLPKKRGRFEGDGSFTALGCWLIGCSQEGKVFVGGWKNLRKSNLFFSPQTRKWEDDVYPNGRGVSKGSRLISLGERSISMGTALSLYLHEYFSSLSSATTARENPPWDDQVKGWLFLCRIPGHAQLKTWGENG